MLCNPVLIAARVETEFTLWAFARHAAGTFVHRSRMDSVSLSSCKPQGTVPRALAAQLWLRPLVQCAARHHYARHSGCLPVGVSADSSELGEAIPGYITRTTREAADERQRSITVCANQGTANISFSFDGKKLYGIEGDTVASLLANGYACYRAVSDIHLPAAKAFSTQVPKEPDSGADRLQPACRAMRSLHADSLTESRRKRPAHQAGRA